MCSSLDTAENWWLDSLAVGGISLVILSPRTVEPESDGGLQAARCWFPELETDEQSVENKTPASSLPRNEGLWDETITSYVTAGIPELRVLASCDWQEPPQPPRPLFFLSSSS